MRVGANYLGDGECQFTLWGPLLQSVGLVIVDPDVRDIPMKKDEKGYWRVTTDDVFPGCRYLFQIDGSSKRPDPASHYQPEGVHGPSQVIDHEAFAWEDENWTGLPLREMLIYELHVGTFTEEGTFRAVISKLDDLKELGVTAIELMPVGQYPGERNWGYDVAYPYSVQNSYGGPEGLKELANACHGNGIALILDVIYNHLGPEGNYLGEFAPYFSRKYKTPWGEAINFDGPFSDAVREYFIQNALYWFHHFHIDALRLDAIHGIFDMSARPFLKELAERVEVFSLKHGRKYQLIAESDLNDVRIIMPPESGGYGIDAQWCDDFHHSLHTLLTGEEGGYYQDFGEIGHLAKAYREGFVYTWEYSRYRKRFFGSSSVDRPADQFIVFSQNHDQVGNRMLGDRLATLVPFEALKLAAGAVLLSPYIPLLFMGEEYGEESPFLYFTSHLDPDLAEAVRRGRKKDFKAFLWKGEPPDPQSPETFVASRLKWEKRRNGKHGVLLRYYRELISFRKVLPALSNLDNNSMEVIVPEGEKIIVLRRWFEDEEAVAIMNFSDRVGTATIRPAGGELNRLIDSSDERWMGPGSKLPERVRGSEEIVMSPFSCALFGAGVRA